jgi:hypothetical protein
MTYTISSQERTGEFHRVPLRRGEDSKDNAMEAARYFSTRATLCDVVVTQGAKHIATYRDGKITVLNGKEYKQ